MIWVEMNEMINWRLISNKIYKTDKKYIHWVKMSSYKSKMHQKHLQRTRAHIVDKMGSNILKTTFLESLKTIRQKGKLEKSRVMSDPGFVSVANDPGVSPVSRPAQAMKVDMESKQFTHSPAMTSHLIRFSGATWPPW